MNRKTDPRWIAVAGRIYGLCLKLYPSALQKEYGDEMKIAFRDRCREAFTRGDGPLGLLFREWLPDLLRSVTESHIASPAFASSPRQILALGLLCLSLLGLVMKDQLSGLVLDTGFAIRNQWREYRYRSELERLEGIARLQAASLAGSPDAENRAIGAYLYGSLAPGRVATVEVIGQDEVFPGWVGFPAGLPEGAIRAKELVAELGRTSSSAPVLATAALACDPTTTDCDRTSVVKKLLEVDSNNAFAWGLAYAEATRRGDVVAQGASLHAMAGAHRYESYRGPMNARLFAAATSLDGSVDHMAAISWAEQRATMGTLADWYNDVRFACTPRQNNASSRPHWIDLHPESASDCARIAVLLSRSNDFRSAMWGERRLRAIAAKNEDSRAARDRWNELAWLEQHRGGIPHEGRIYTPWTREQWARWATVNAPGDGEIPAMRRWMLANGEPLLAPQWFLADRP